MWDVGSIGPFGAFHYQQALVRLCVDLDFLDAGAYVCDASGLAKRDGLSHLR